MSYYNRSDKVGYYGIPTTSGSTTTWTYHRMRNFTALSTSKNAKEYTRQYVDEVSETTTLTGYSTSVSYNFDFDDTYDVHNDIVNITDNELIGSEAIRRLLVVDMKSKDQQNKYDAILRDVSVIPDSEGDSTDAYTYSGALKAVGENSAVKVTLSDNDQVATISTT